MLICNYWDSTSVALLSHLQDVTGLYSKSVTETDVGNMAGSQSLIASVWEDGLRSAGTDVNCTYIWNNSGNGRSVLFAFRAASRLTSFMLIIKMWSRTRIASFFWKYSQTELASTLPASPLRVIPCLLQYSTALTIDFWTAQFHSMSIALCVSTNALMVVHGCSIDPLVSLLRCSLVIQTAHMSLALLTLLIPDMEWLAYQDTFWWIRTEFA